MAKPGPQRSVSAANQDANQQATQRDGLRSRASSEAPQTDLISPPPLAAGSATASPPDAEAFAQACADDREMRLAVRHWNGGVRFCIGQVLLGFTATDGEIDTAVPSPGAGVITVTGPPEQWLPLLQHPQPRLGRLAPMTVMGALSIDESDLLAMWQYLPAVERAAELLRDLAANAAASPDGDEALGPHRAEHGVDHSASTQLPDAAARHDTPVGRYIRVELEDAQRQRNEFRLYYEEAGTGIPLLLQHTAGAQSSQYRHLFECAEITDRFRLIAYDLPHHGKSLPSEQTRWWETEYRLEGHFLRQVPLALAAGLGLERPVFMGCSVGGLLALDLALRHADAFRAVISIGGALHIGGDWEGFGLAWHPAVSSHAKARLMESLCGPDAPTPYVKEVSHVYASAWPPVFRGDLHYYMVEHDLRDRAHEIDTDTVGVHILSGEHDWSGLLEYGQAAHEAIAGSTFTVMDGVGHFAMQENPEVFLGFLLRVLDEIA